MLLIRCAACKRKLWKYDKIGQGKVLRCYKDRIERHYNFQVEATKVEATKVEATKVEATKVKCTCGKEIGLDKGDHIKMIAKAFTYRGTKRNKA